MALLTKIAAGDEKAFGIVFHHYRKRIYAYAFHLFENKEMADELVQDVFLKLWLSRDKIPGIVKFDAWLFIIARNRIFDTLKLLSREIVINAQIEGGLLPDPNTVENQLIDKENEALLNQALGRLSPQQKLIFTLSRNQGMKHEEIASRLNISRNTVKTHLVHALKVLRAALPLHSDTVGLFLLLLHYAN
jgi:RNA polymerase sigma-70 factor (ECF subfamily)